VIPKKKSKVLSTASLILLLIACGLMFSGCKDKPDPGCVQYLACCSALMGDPKTKGPFGDACSNTSATTMCGNYKQDVTNVSVKTRISLPAACKW